jgi:RNA polymerase sigma-70 factor (ECF subfamily)
MSSLYDWSDEQLVAEAAAGETGALSTLYDRHAPAVMGFAVRLLGEPALAEEAVQETFWRVWRNAAAYQRERAPFTVWLFAIARRLCIDMLRRRRAALVDDEVLEALPDPGADVTEQVSGALEHAQVRAALSSLPAEQRRVLELAYFRGLTHHEIAQTTSEPLGTIHTRARLGLQKLRAVLLKQGIES